MALNGGDWELGPDLIYAPEETDFLAPAEANAVHELAASQSSERRQFLTNSLGKNVSPSTEVLKDMVLSLYESGKKIVGIDSPIVMGAIGDRSKDSGLGKPDKPQVSTDFLGRLTEYAMPDGTKYEIEYGLLLTPNEVTITREGGKQKTYEKTLGGKWQEASNPNDKLDAVEFDPQSRTVTLKDSGNETTLSPDGSYKSLIQKIVEGKQTLVLEGKIDPDGTSYRYAPGTETVFKPGSHIAQVNSVADNAVRRYEFRDDQGRHTEIKPHGKDGAIVSKGNESQYYTKLVRTDDGDLKLSNGFGTPSLEFRQDGTQILRDERKRIVSITNSDGEVTTFARNGRGKVTGLTVSDGQGHEVERRSSGIEVDEATGNYKVVLSATEAEARKVDGGEGTAVKLERNADGTERLLAGDQATQIKSDAEKLLDKFNNYTEQQKFELRQDLADIDRLPEKQRAKIYESLNKIARNDEHPEDKIKLNGQQARELVASLAHQIAHPESIEQGAHNTCAAASMEHIAARSHPEVYAEMVANLATQGEYRTAGGKLVYAETHDGKLDGKSDLFGERSYASELFQDAVADLAVRLESPPRRYKSVSLDSADIHPRPEGVTPATDFGERLINPNPLAPPEKFPGLTTPQQLRALMELFPSDFYGSRPVTTPEELEQAFFQNGFSPMQVGIDLTAEQFTGMSGGGYHALVVTNIKDGRVYFENSSGGTDRSYPHGEGVAIADFVQAMKADGSGAFVRYAWPAGAYPVG